MTDRLSSLLEHALAAARGAGERILPYFLHVSAERKADGSVLTEADRVSEAYLREQLGALFPDHAFLGEETGRSGPSHARWTWVVDPLDGTAGFLLGVPLFGVLVGLLDRGEPVLGVIHTPALPETVYARRGGGCWFAGRGDPPRRVRVAEEMPLERASISVTSLQGTDLQPAEGVPAWGFSRLLGRAGLVRFVPDCYQQALVCRGLLHAAVEPAMSAWDVAALVPCVEEAGGVVTTLCGRREGVVEGGSLLTSCGAELHRKLLEVLRPPPPSDASERVVSGGPRSGP